MSANLKVVVVFDAIRTNVALMSAQCPWVVSPRSNDLGCSASLRPHRRDWREMARLRLINCTKWPVISFS